MLKSDGFTSNLGCIMTQIMEFDCKLAHEAGIKRLSNFNSINELYCRISQTFNVETSDILYCTLNTHNYRNMDSILGNYLSYGDLIVVHLCGAARKVTIKKTQEFLGLTITDNSNGRAFVKRVKSDDKHVEDNIKPGDHIASINLESTIGWRHYEVAAAIRQVPQGSQFTLGLTEPRYNNKYLESELDMGRENGCITNASKVGRNFATNRLTLLNPPRDDLNCTSLPIDRLLSKNKLVNGEKSSEKEDSYKATIDKINDSLESFLGISDNLLAIKIYRLARENKDSYKAFSDAIGNSDLKEFNFNEEMKDYLWKCATDLSAQ